MAGINFYTNKAEYQDEIRTQENLEFRHFDIKVGLENSIFTDRTAIGIGLQLEYMYDLKIKVNRDTNEYTNLPIQHYLGFELTSRHRIKKIEIFLDAFFKKS